jgi:hypothetical protein
MAKIKNTTPNTLLTDAMLEEICSTSQQESAAKKTAIATILKYIDWSNADNVDIVSRNYKAGKLMNCGRTNDESFAILDNPPVASASGATSSPETQRLFKDYRIAVSAWSGMRLLAGAPNAQKKAGGERAKRGANVKAAKTGEVVNATLPAIVKFENAGQWNAYMLRMADHIGKTVQANKDIADKGDLGDVARHFVVDTSKYANKPSEQ